MSAPQWLSSKLVMAGMLALFVWPCIGVTRTAAAAETIEALNAEIASETAQLVPKPRSIVLISETALKAREAIKWGDFAAAGKTISDILANSHIENWRFYPFNLFMFHIAREQDDVLLAKLNEWVDSQPDSAIAYLVRAKYYDDVGWVVRGSQFWANIQPKNREKYQQYLQQAAEDVSSSIQIKSDNPYAYFLLLEIIKSGGNTAEVDDAFKKGIEKFPTYYPLYEQRLFTLQPKWGGSIGAMYDFVDRYAANAPAGSPLKMLYARLYAHLMDAAYYSCGGFDGDARQKCSATQMDRTIDKALEGHLTEAIDLYDKTDHYQFTGMMWSILPQMLAVSGGEARAGAVLEQVAAKMGSGNQLVTEPGQHNNYMLDAVTASVWVRSEFYDNAEKKFLQALDEAAVAPFPDEQSKDFTLYALYEDLADLYRRKSLFEKMIVYRNAAVAIAGDVDINARHLKCLGYFQLGYMEEALKECTLEVDRGDDRDSRYWRARVNAAMGRKDEALLDYLPVADSESRWRTSAVINMSVLYGDKGDFNSGLNVLESHPFVFNENSEEKSNLAVAFNNRCYFRMKLGDLQKALDDCNTSLKFGNIPDAFSKKNDLMKLLAK